MKLLIADIILLVHAAVVLFIVVGQVGIVISPIRQWRWPRHRAFRLCHLLAIGLVIVFACTLTACPLTAWESALREAAGQPGYPGTFVGYWVGRLLYFDAPEWTFVAGYSLFGAITLASWIWIPPRPGRRARNGRSA